MRKSASLFLAVVLLLSLTGCKKGLGDISLKSGENGIYVASDGKVTYAAKEDFSKDYLKKSELKEKAENEVKDFNDTEGSVVSAMELNDVSIKDKTAYIEFSFVTLYDLTKYIKMFEGLDKDQFYIGHISDYNPDGSEKLLSKSKKEKVKIEDIQNDEYYIFTVSRKTKFEVDGNIKYYSSNCKIEDNMVTTKDDEKSYIVFEIKGE